MSNSFGPTHSVDCSCSDCGPTVDREPDDTEPEEPETVSRQVPWRTERDTHTDSEGEAKRHTPWGDSD